ncbi:MAG: hypothetical protein WCK42_01530 [Myxococcaceae bacterium]
MIPKTLILTILLTSTSILATDWSTLGKRLKKAGEEILDNTLKVVEPKAKEAAEILTEIAEDVAEKTKKVTDDL